MILLTQQHSRQEGKLFPAHQVNFIHIIEQYEQNSINCCFMRWASLSWLNYCILKVFHRKFNISQRSARLSVSLDHFPGLGLSLEYS